jgi:hypothetical protein|tara:strand:- start:161 stop:319 length:159 start_codon:yes stop_codon:yes gene_type:complete
VKFQSKSIDVLKKVPLIGSVALGSYLLESSSITSPLPVIFCTIIKLGKNNRL